MGTLTGFNLHSGLFSANQLDYANQPNIYPFASNDLIWNELTCPSLPLSELIWTDMNFPDVVWTVSIFSSTSVVRTTYVIDIYFE